VPPDHLVGRDQEQVAAPVAPDDAGEQPEQLVPGAQARALAGRAGDDRELLAQQEVLRGQFAMAADDRAEQGREEATFRVLGLF
jgi:hypothetical protein